MLNVNTGKLQQALTLCNQTTSQILSLDCCFYEWRLYQKTRKLSNDLAQLQQFYQGSIDAYEQSEQAVKDGLQSIESALSKLIPEKTKVNAQSSFWDTTLTYGKAYTRFHHSFTSGKTLKDYLKNGVCIGAFGSIHALDLKVGKDMKYMDLEGRLSLGNLEGSADAKFQLYEEEVLNPSLELKGKIIGSLGEAKVIMGLGTSLLHVDAEATGRVGVAKAEGEITINKEELTMQGEIGVAALQGDVKGSFYFFGTKITVTGEGELGSAGLGAEFSSKDGELEFGGKVSFLAGIGLKVKIEY